jgi:osmotically-inducible protein OsmY
MLKLLSLLLAFSMLACFVMAADKPVNDDVIVDQVRVRLASDAIVKGGGLAVDCKSGVVTLSGVVPTTKQKDRAGKVAAKVKGVKQVVNNITITPVGK